MRAVFLGFLRHQPDVRNRAHGLGIERAVGLAVLDGGLEQPSVGAIRDDGLGVVQFAVRAPHVAAFADHRGYRSVDDHVAGHMQARNALVGIHHREGRALRVLGRDVVLDRPVGQVQLRHAQLLQFGAHRRTSLSLIRHSPRARVLRHQFIHPLLQRLAPRPLFFHLIFLRHELGYHRPHHFANVIHPTLLALSP